jgi:hypothetical protein
MNEATKEGSKEGASEGANEGTHEDARIGVIEPRCYACGALGMRPAPPEPHGSHGHNHDPFEWEWEARAAAEKKLGDSFETRAQCRFFNFIQSKCQERMSKKLIKACEKHARACEKQMPEDIQKYSRRMRKHEQSFYKEACEFLHGDGGDFTEAFARMSQALRIREGYRSGGEEELIIKGPV